MDYVRMAVMWIEKQMYVMGGSCSCSSGWCQRVSSLIDRYFYRPITWDEG